MSGPGSSATSSPTGLIPEEAMPARPAVPRRAPGVEVTTRATAVGVRDGKDPAGPVLLFEQHRFGAFLRSVRTGLVPRHAG